MWHTERFTFCPSCCLGANWLCRGRIVFVGEVIKTVLAEENLAHTAAAATQLRAEHKISAKRKTACARRLDFNGHVNWACGWKRGGKSYQAYQRRWQLELGSWRLPLPLRWGRAPQWYRSLPLAVRAWWRGWWFSSPGCGVCPPVWVTPAGHVHEATLSLQCIDGSYL